MPTPVKRLVSTNAVQPTRGGAAPAGPQAAEGETFRDELVRRRKSAATKSEPARKVEAKRTTKARKAVKAAREERAPEAAAERVDATDALVAEGARGVEESEATDVAAVATPQAAESDEAEEADARAEVAPLAAPAAPGAPVEVSDAEEPQTDVAPDPVATVEDATTPRRLAKRIDYPGAGGAQKQEGPGDASGAPAPAAGGAGAARAAPTVTPTRRPTARVSSPPRRRAPPA